MGKFNHTCKVCGTGYNACDTCLNEKNYAPWRAIACTQGHFQAYMVLWEYGNGTLERADAREMLSKVDIEGWEDYPEHNRVVIAEILKDDEKPVPEVIAPVKAVEPLAVEKPAPVMQTQPQNYGKPQPKYNNNFQGHKK